MIDGFSVSLALPLLDQVTPASRFIVAVVAGSLACLFLAIASAVQRRRINRIPVRIHVAGTRGKSTVTRLVAAGLRAGGHRVVAKVTGTQPKLILPDGSEVLIRRWGAVSIREQSALLRTATRLNADALVVESMAIEPEYLGALERFYIRATDLAITNVRPDHLEQLGENPDAMARAIARAMPSGAHVFVTAEAATPVIRDEARRRRCELTVVENIDDRDPETANLTLARAICRRYKVDGTIAEVAMLAAQKDIGAFSLQHLTIEGRLVRFANAFSCNDVESFRQLWHRHQPAGAPATFLFNARIDRPLRSRAFLGLLPRLSPDAALYLTHGSRMLLRWAMNAGFDRSRVHLLADGPARDQLTRIVRGTADGTIIWGTGNFRGAGAEITAFANTEARAC